MTPASKLIRSARISAKFTREQVASILAITVHEYANIEEGNLPLNEQLVDDFVNLFGISRAALSKSVGPRPGQLKTVQFTDKETTDQ